MLCFWALLHRSLPRLFRQLSFLLCTQRAMGRDNQAIREAIRIRLASGELPHFLEQSIFAGNGDKQPCVCCGDAITSEDIQYDVVLLDERILFMHMHCFNVWCEESRSG